MFISGGHWRSPKNSPITAPLPKIMIYHEIIRVNNRQLRHFKSLKNDSQIWFARLVSVNGLFNRNLIKGYYLLIFFYNILSWLSGRWCFHICPNTLTLIICVFILSGIWLIEKMFNTQKWRNIFLKVKTPGKCSSIKRFSYPII